MTVIPTCAPMSVDVTGDARDEMILWDQERVWIYTQDRPFKGERIYAPLRNPDYNESNSTIAWASLCRTGWKMGNMRNRRFLLVLLAEVCASAALAETHQFAPHVYYRTFNATNPVGLRIKSGDTVVTKTLDAAGGNEQKRHKTTPGDEWGTR